MEINKTVGQNIQKWRQFKGIKQDDLAEQLHISRAALSQWENGETDLTLDRIDEVARLMEIDISLLLSQPQQINNFHGPNGIGVHGVNNNFDKEILNGIMEELQTKNRQIEQLLQIIAGAQQK